jgi:protein required for attachment to host cells
LAHHLNEAAAAGEFDQLILAAPPRALGDLRKALGAPATQALKAEIGKDLTGIPLSDLPDHLEDYVRL